MTRSGWRDTLRPVLSALETRLAALEFTPKTKSIFVRPLADDVASWIGLASQEGNRPGTIDIDPAVGVRHGQFEIVRQQLLPKYSLRDATVAENLGYLMPDERYVYWSFDPDEEIAGAADELVSALIKFGLPYMHSLIEPDAVVRAIEERPAGREYELPIALLAIGDVSRAVELVQAELASLEDQEGHWPGFFHDFASRFFDYVRRREEGTEQKNVLGRGS